MTAAIVGALTASLCLLIDHWISNEYTEYKKLEAEYDKTRQETD